MDRGIGGIGSIRDIGDPYDPRRGLPRVEQRDIPGLVAGKGATIYTPSYLDDVAGYMANQARTRGPVTPGNANPATGFYEPSSGQLSLGIRPGRDTVETVLVPQLEARLAQAVEVARRENRALPARIARPSEGDNQGRPLGVLIGDVDAPPSSAALVEQLLTDPAASVPGDQIVVARPRSELPGSSRLARQGRPRTVSPADRPGPARGAARADAAAEARAGKVLRNLSGTLRDGDMADYEAFANALLGEEPVAARQVDASVSDNERYGAFTSEDPTEYRGKAQFSGDVNPFFTVEVPARAMRPDGRGASWTVDTGKGFRPSTVEINPGAIVETRTQNPRRLQGTRGGFAAESDNTAGFLREQQVSVGDLAKEALQETKTPVITKSALEAARSAGRARAASPEERDRNLVGWIVPPGGGEELPVYAVTDREGKRKTADIDRPLGDFGSEKVKEEYFRIGSPINRDGERLRGALREALGVDPASETAPAPLLANVWDRRYAEDKLGAPSLEAFARELAAGGFMQDPDEGGSTYRTLAKALQTGLLEVPDRTPGARPGAMTAVPVDRATVLSLYSNIAANDAPEIKAGKQFRAFLQEAPRPLTVQEGVDAAAQLGARWGVDANAVLRAAAERREVELPLPAGENGAAGAIRTSVPANDPGRPLFAPGSNAERLLGQALREIRGSREVDLFAEPPIDPRMVPLPEERTPVQGVVDAAELFGSAAEDDFGDEGVRQGRYGDFGDAGSGISVRNVDVTGGDPLTRAAIALTGDTAQGSYLADVARRAAAPGRVTPVNQYGTAVGAAEELPKRDPRAVLLELTGRRAPLEVTPGAQQLRERYQGDYASISQATGQPVLGQRGYQMMAQALGEEPGSAAHDRAMSLLAERLAQRRSGGETAPAVDPADAYRAARLAEYGGVSPRGSYGAAGPQSDFLGLGSAPGTWMHDRAMDLSAVRQAARRRMPG